jgi:hypothetical protein
MTPAVMMIVSRTDQRPQPTLTDIQRERATMLAMFEAPHNLPLPVFAKLAGKVPPPDQPRDPRPSPVYR